MDDAVLAAMARWPGVPEVYDWLRLDRRGRWRLKGERIDHAGLHDFICRNYAADAAGRHFVQNGPQRVFVRLDYTPWILRIGDGGLTTHCGTPFDAPDAAFIDEEGAVLVSNRRGEIGLIDDRDLPAVLDRLMSLDGEPADPEALANIDRQPLQLLLDRLTLPVRTLRRAEVARRFPFDPNPLPPD
ncbi:MAG: DUF2946 family protein [Rhodocyclaceae bacterium]|nr:DUF2946 family protein [Rhodocyclaceae bacterium]